nr:hypothetical protein [Tanacetum cinerariifolium]
MFWHTARDDPMFMTIRVISKNQTTQIYSAILPKQLRNQAMIESKAYKTYAYATAKVPKLGKKKLLAQGLETLSEIALSEAEQMKIATKRSRVQFHVSHDSSSSAHEGIGFKLRVPNTPKYGSDDEQMSWKSSDEDDDDEDTADDNDDDQDDDVENDDEQTKSENDGNDFVHPKFSTHDEEDRKDEGDKEEESFDPRVRTPSHYESIDDEAYDEINQRDNVEEEKLDEEKTHEEE